MVDPAQSQLNPLFNLSSNSPQKNFLYVHFNGTKWTRRDSLTTVRQSNDVTALNTLVVNYKRSAGPHVKMWNLLT